jgi:O-antigen/teichoic acid export membrane protein
MSKEKKVLIGNISSLFSVEVANYILPMISLPIIVRIIGPDKFGVINYAFAIVGYFVLLVNYGFDLTGTRKVAQNKHDKQYIDELFSLILWSKVLLFLITLVVFALCFIFIPVFMQEWEVMVFTYLVVLSWVFTPNWLYQGMQELHRIAIFNIVIKLLFTISVLIIIRQKSDYVYQPLSMAIAQIIVGFYSFRFAIRRYKINLVKVGFKQILSILKDDRIIFFSQIIIYLYTATNTIILGSLATDTQVGYYSAALRFIQIAQAIITLPLSNSFFPYVSAAFGKSKEEGIMAASKVVPIVSIISLVAFLGMVTLGPWALQLFFGDKFTASVPIFITMAILPFLVVVSNVYGIQVMLSLKMDKAFFRITACGAILSVCCNLLLVPLYGGLGSGFSLLITESFITITFALYLIQKGINIIRPVYFHPKKIMLQFQSVLSVFKK